jgi:hypothetical protein
LYGNPILKTIETIETQNGPLFDVDADWLFEKETISRPRVPALLGNKSRYRDSSEINFGIRHEQRKPPQSWGILP